MRRPLSLSLCIPLFVATSLAAAQPTDKGGGKGGGGAGGGEATQFLPEIAYVYRDTKGAELRFASGDGSAEIVVHRTSGANIHAIDVSSEAAKLVAYTTSEGVFVRQWQAVPLSVGAARQIFSGEAHFVDFSSDDEQLLFSTGHELYVHDLQARSTTLLAFGGTKAYPRWSPDRSGDVFFFGGADENAPLDLRKYHAATGTVDVLRSAGAGFSWQLGMDVTRPPATGLLYETAKLALAEQVGTGDYRLRFFDLNGSPIDEPNVPGTDFHFDCSNNRVLHHLEQGRNDAIGMTYLGGTPTTWKKDSRIRTNVTDWMRRKPC